MKIKPLYCFLAAFLFLLLAWRVQMHATSVIFGDAVYYVDDAMRVHRGEYSHRNLTAWREGTESVKLVTEGGYAFLLAGLRWLVGSWAAFLPQRLLLPVFIFLAALMIRVRDSRRTLIAGGLTLALFLLNPQLVGIFGLLLRPLRQFPAHLLSLGVCFFAFSPGLPRTRHCLLAGFAAGLSIWFHLLAGLLLFAPFARVLSVPDSSWRQRGGWTLWLALGVIVGLLPMASQHTFEQSHRLTDVRAVRIVRSASMSVGEVEERGRPPSIHPVSFLGTFPTFWRGLSYGHHPLFYVGFAVSLLGLLRKERRVLLIAGSICLPGMIAAGMYSKYIPRYFIMVMLVFYATMAFGVVLAGVGMMRGPRSARGKRGLEAGGMVLLVALVWRTSFLPGAPRVSMETARKYVSWLEDHVQEDETLYVGTSTLIGWTSWFGSRSYDLRPWAWTAGTTEFLTAQQYYPREYNNMGTRMRGEEHLASIREKIREGEPVYVLSWFEASSKAPLQSWWRNDMLAHFDLQPVGEFTMGEMDNFSLRLEKFGPFPTAQTLHVPAPDSATRFVLLKTGFPESLDPERGGAFVEIRTEEDTLLLKRPLKPGRMLLRLDAVPDTTALRVEIQGEWTRSIDATWLDHPQFDLLPHPAPINKAPEYQRLLRGFELEPTNPITFGRDYTGNPTVDMRTRYGFHFTREQHILLPDLDAPATLVLVFHLTSDLGADDIDLPGFARVFRDGRELEPHVWSTNKEERDGEVITRHHLGMMSVPLTKEGTRHLEIHEGPHFEAFDRKVLMRAFVRRLESENLPNKREEPLVSFFPKTADLSWPESLLFSDTHSLSQPGMPAVVALPRDEGQVRVFEFTRLGPLPEVAPKALLSFSDHQLSIPFADRGAQTERFFIWIADPGVKDNEPPDHVRVQVDRGSWMVRALPIEGSLDANSFTMDEIRFDPQTNALLEFEGLYRPERQQDGRHAQWTSGEVSLSIPVFQSANKVMAQLEMRGPPASVIARTLTVRHAGRVIHQADLPAWEDGWITVRFPLHPEVTSSGKLDMELTFDLWRPSDTWETSQDRRKLGAYLRRMTFSHDL